MIQVYSGKFLHIHFNNEKKLFVQNWIESPTSIKCFKHEMLAYTKKYEEFKPMYTLWLQVNFNLSIDEETFIWIEENVNKPCFQYGNKKCAFVVSKDVLTHVQTIDVFDKTNSCIKPKHFVSEKKAYDWLDSKEDAVNSSMNSKITYEGVDENGNIILKVPTNNIKQTFKNIHKSLEEELFLEKHKEKLSLLTDREKEILKLISIEKKHREIAEILFISQHTVHTHVKNIKSKLEFENKSDLKLISKFI